MGGFGHAGGHHDHGHHVDLHFGGFGHGSGYGHAYSYSAPYYYGTPYYYSQGYPYTYGYRSTYSGYPSGYSHAPSYAYNRYEAPPPAADYPPIDRRGEATADATTRPRRDRAAGIERDGRKGSAMEAGLTLLKQGAYQRATDVLLQAVLADPEAGLPKLAFADALFATDDYDYAAYAVRRGIDRVSDIAVVLADRRSLFRDDKELDRLAYRLRHFVQRHRTSADAHFLLGYYHLVMDQPEEARKSFDAALDLDSHDRHALVLRDLAKAHEPAKP
ncbi:MAG: tetratricopeptide repeat protein [Phycisphaerae bacterium]